MWRVHCGRYITGRLGGIFHKLPPAPQTLGMGWEYMVHVRLQEGGAVLDGLISRNIFLSVS